MEPSWFEHMNVPAGMEASSAQSQSAAKNLPQGVPPLASRWDCSMDFALFTEKTLGSYY
jgi:hypothetical protein